MAMPSGNVVMSDKMQFPNGGVVGNSQQWYPDERDGFISWIKGEFAAANAIIDAMCHHLKMVGEPGEYEGVIGSIQQRRCNWSPVLHMQQYFSVAEVTYALQQAAWRRQQHQQRVYDPPKMGKEYRRSGYGPRQGQRFESVREGQNSQNYGNAYGNSVGEETKVDKDVNVANNDNGVSTKPIIDSCGKSSGNALANSPASSDCEAKEVDDGCNSNPRGYSKVENDSTSTQNSHVKQNHSVVAKNFVATEMVDGKEINVVDGLEMLEGLVDDPEVEKLVTLVNGLRSAGRGGQSRGQTYVVSKRPIRGHGREVIQLGVPIVDVPYEDEAAGGTSKDQKVDPIPSLLVDVIERLMAMQIVTVKPDTCVVDIYKEGEHSQPHFWPHWYGRPVCVLFLTECDMILGRNIGIGRPGDFTGSLKLSLAPGSMLVMQGKSADFARHAIPTIRKQRMFVTFTKSLPKRTTFSDHHRFPAVAVAPPSNWASPPSRSPNHIRHPAGPKHYVPVQTAAVLPPPPVSPIFVPAVAFPPSVALPPASTGWPAAPRMHPPPPRLPLPGTGVFLPPGSPNSSSLPTVVAESVSDETVENGNGKSDGNDAAPSPHEAGKMLGECNGNVDGTAGETAGTEEQQQQLQNAH